LPKIGAKLSIPIDFVVSLAVNLTYTASAKLLETNITDTSSKQH